MRILLATDGSKFSLAAAEKCCDLLIRRGEATVMVLGAYEAPVPMAAEPFGISGEYYQQMSTLLKNRAITAVGETVVQIRKRFPGEDIVLETRTEPGSPAPIIVEIADEWKADIIVVGSHGHGFWGRTLLGSVSTAVLHHAHCSVLVARGPNNLE